MIFCNFKLTKKNKSYMQARKLEMLNYLKDSLESKTASINASIEVLEQQIKRDKEKIDNE